ncbi:MAG: serine/threonine protein kinase [Gemmataceae bacterium]|nr:serine/threonine protein kinase [Gemmataceae bacterium]
MFNPFSNSQTAASRPKRSLPTEAGISNLTTVGPVGIDSGWPAPELTTIGGFDIESVIASGGMGVVYKARERKTGRAVAVKTIRRDLLTTPDLRERFRREVNVGDFAHPNVMPVLEAGDSDGRPYLVMPLADDTLAHHTHEYRNPVAAVSLMVRVCRGVDAADRAGVLHRDLKPGNILMENGEPRVADFGLAKLLDDVDTESLTATGALVGTLPYMSPEQAVGAKQEIGPASDVWSLGVILYELLAGQRPFDAETRNGTLERIRKVDPPALTKLAPEVDRPLEAIVLACLAKSPAARYQSAGALADDLEAWQRGEVTWAVRRLGLFERFRRSVRRWPAAYTTLVLIFLGSIAIGFLGQGLAGSDAASASAEGLNTQLASLDSGASVELIGNRRGPVWYDWARTIGRPPRLERAGSGFLILDAQRYELLTLLPRTNGSFRLEATFRRISSNQAGNDSFGIFAGWKRTNAKLVYHSYFTTSVMQVGGPNAFQECGCKAITPGSENMTRSYITNGPPPPFVEAPDRRTYLSIAFTDAGISGSVNNKVIGTEKWSLVDNQFAAAKIAGILPEIKPSLNRTGPVGIFVDRSRVEVERVTITPLTTENSQ